MSLHEAYRLAHSAECRLNISASRPDRNLRVVVGHLMHYEALRLRIVEIEHDISRRERTAVRFQYSEHTNDLGLRHMSSTAQLGRKSPPPDALETEHPEDEDLYDESDECEDADEDSEALQLSRFPSGASQPPALVPDVEDDDEAAGECQSPEEPDHATLEQALKRSADTDLAQHIEKIRRCPCHSHTESPSIENVWVLPPSADDKPGITRAVAQVTE